MTVRTGRPVRPFRAIASGFAAVLLVAACGGSGGAAGAAPSPGPGSTPPAGFRPHSVGALTFEAPATWSPVTVPTGSGPATGAQLALRAPAPAGQAGPVALALLDPTPGRDAAAEVDSLVTIKRDVHKADVRTLPLALAGFTAAVLVSYDEDLLTGERQRTDLLVGDLLDGTLVTLTVKAEAALFGQLELGAIARSSRALQRS